MNYKMIGRFLSVILALEAIFMIPALLICLYDRDFSTALSFVISIAIIIVFALPMYLFCRNAKKGFYAREGMICVGSSWIIISLLGCMPFYLSGQIPSYIDALFEMVSGFTTTGASIVPNVEALTRGILYWRSFSHWLGGMGVLVFVLALTTDKGANSGFTLHLLRAESPGPNVGKLVPRMRETAVLLYILYIVLTILDFVFLLIGKMPVFDAICTALGTAGTGGFGIKADSIAGYSPYLQNVCTIFMLLFGINFNCYFFLLIRHFKSFFKDEELRMYLITVLSSVALITYNIRHLYPTISECIRHAFFQTASIVTTTGFATTDFDQWPNFSKGILLFLMIIGACAGSTGGGLKCVRVLLLFRTLKRNIRQVLFPNNVQVVRVNDQPMSEKVLANTNAYLTAYVTIIVLSFLLISMNGFSITTNISSVLACFNNIGPGFEMVGPCGNYADFNVISKLVLIFDMLAGRLEIVPFLAVFAGSSWKRG